jgi:hydrogenase nickel incorporation protein HypB
MKIKVVKDLLESNDAVAINIKKRLKKYNIFAVNFMSSPGSGKTRILEKLIEKYYNKKRIAIIEGDVATTLDSERLAKHNVPVVQIDTEIFGGGCHLTAGLIEKALQDIQLSEIDMLFIENIGNLICPGSYNLGEDKKVIVLSITEGSEKPLKYPQMFRIADAVILNKIDLAPHLDTNVDDYVKNIKQINAKVPIYKISAKTNEGIDELIKWFDADMTE